VNAIAPIVTEPGGRAWRQTIFHPFALTARYARGVVLNTRVIGGNYTTAQYGDVALVDAVATHDPDNREVAVFFVNRSQDEPTRVELDLGAGFRDVRIVEAVQYSHPDPYWTPTADDADRVLPVPFEPAVTGPIVSAELPPVSWAMVRIAYGAPRS
jgi:alpha-N-arabinofuranosidase